MRYIATMIILLPLGLAGCFKFEGTVPDPIIGGGPTPPANIRPANPNDRADVVRENHELRARNAYLERQIPARQRKHDDLKQDQREIKADISRLQRELSSYER